MSDSGNSYTAGSFRDTAWFGTTNLTADHGLDWNNIFIAKHNPQGELLCVIGLFTTNSADPGGIVLDESDNFYLMGRFSSLLSFRDTNFMSESASDSFLAKFPREGAIQWFTAIGGTNDGVELDGSGGGSSRESLPARRL